MTMQKKRGRRRLEQPNRPAGSTPSGHIVWLEGVRALAALYVVIHHSWLMAVGGYPSNNGPWYTDWMIYGHLAVSVFIVVSGFSLSISPSRHGMALQGGGRTFLWRRFWRIVPPYWAALLLVTLLIGLGLTEPANGTHFSAKDFAVYALLFQDAVGNVSPNGAFWSIAVEWHIYFLFPLVMIGWRKWGLARMFALVVTLVVAQHVAGHWFAPLALFDRFTPAYLVLFVAGGTAATFMQRRQWDKAAVWFGALLALAALGYVLLVGSEFSTNNYFWLDMAVGISTAAIFVALGQNRLRWLARSLSFTWLRRIGEFAFSLYLVHAPVLAITNTNIVRPLGLSDGWSLFVLILLGVPCSIAISYLFFLLFEKPFLRIRSWKQFKDAVSKPGRQRVVVKKFALTSSGSEDGLENVNNTLVVETSDKP